MHRRELRDGERDRYSDALRLGAGCGGFGPAGAASGPGQPETRSAATRADAGADRTLPGHPARPRADGRALSAGSGPSGTLGEQARKRQAERAGARNGAARAVLGCERETTRRVPRRAEDHGREAGVDPTTWGRRTRAAA